MQSGQPAWGGFSIELWNAAEGQRAADSWQHLLLALKTNATTQESVQFSFSLEAWTSTAFIREVVVCIHDGN